MGLESLAYIRHRRWGREILRGVSPFSYKTTYSYRPERLQNAHSCSFLSNHTSTCAWILLATASFVRIEFSIDLSNVAHTSSTNNLTSLQHCCCPWSGGRTRRYMDRYANRDSLASRSPSLPHFTFACISFRVQRGCYHLFGKWLRKQDHASCPNSHCRI